MQSEVQSCQKGSSDQEKLPLVVPGSFSSGMWTTARVGALGSVYLRQQAISDIAGISRPPRRLVSANFSCCRLLFWDASYRLSKCFQRSSRVLLETCRRASKQCGILRKFAEISKGRDCEISRAKLSMLIAINPVQVDGCAAMQPHITLRLEGGARFNWSTPELSLDTHAGLDAVDVSKQTSFTRPPKVVATPCFIFPPDDLA